MGVSIFVASGWDPLLVNNEPFLQSFVSIQCRLLTIMIASLNLLGKLNLDIFLIDTGIVINVILPNRISFLKKHSNFLLILQFKLA
jgi:hypothetical protein